MSDFTPFHNHSEFSQRDNGPVATGLVVPLVQVGQHFQGHAAKHVINAIAWKEMTPIKREPIIRDVLEGKPSPWTRIVSYTEKVDIEDVIHDAIILWLVPCFKLLSGINKKKSPPEVAKFFTLVKMMLDEHVAVREPIDDWHYTEYHWARLNSYFRLAILEIDENLLEIQANWGN
jgi:hypothetical protein